MADPKNVQTDSISRVHFAPKTEFSKELKHRVDQFFEDKNISRRGNGAMYFKTSLFLLWFSASYLALLFGGLPWWGNVLSAISLGFAMSGIGFSVMHDGGHRSYSEIEWLNKAAALCLDLLGGSSYIWRWKHNVLHHSYSNITHHDDDLNVGNLGRLSPHQEYHRPHRFQHLYMWFLYGFLPVKWHLFDDYNCVYRGKIGAQPFPRPKGSDLAILLIGKALFYSWALIIPAIMYPLWLVLSLYLLTTFVEGLVLAIVFQMAHCLEEADFAEPAIHNPNIETDWCIHQLRTTVNFAPNNKLLSWYVGGLNYQVEHHLFPKISHLHYPKLAKIVEETCREYDIPYMSNPTLSQNLRSHYRWLYQLGREPKAVTE